MSDELKRDIAETYDGSCYEPITGILVKDGTRWQLFKFERDVEFQGRIWRCVWIQKCVYDEDDPTAVLEAVDVFAEAWEL